MSQALVTGLNGLSYAFILFLLAAGFSLTFGVMGVLNLSHGALFVFGAYVGLQVIETLDIFWLAIVLAAVALAAIGFLLYFFFLRHLYNKVPEQAVLTIGLSYVVANTILWIWGPRAQITTPPEILGGALSIGGLSFPKYRVFICVIGLVVLALLWWMQDRTRWGAIIRAGMDNKEMTVSLGINYGLVSTLVFVLGVALAGLGGILNAPITGIHPLQGDNLLLLTLIVVVVGGTGYIQGTMLGALVIGLVDTFGKAYIDEAALFFAYVIFLIILLVRPSGLIGRRVF
ncbi:MAG: branched-chain amino acid ABC transporter permease [Thermoleophilia bacterium]|nr:branched-chain amino acid ABC transporter permease [Thermoleophilia bacterium]